MAILNIQKKKKDAGESNGKKSLKTVMSEKTLKVNVSQVEHLSILKSPRITEKVSRLMELGCYTFDVFLAATKDDVKKAIFARYNVLPVKVNMTRVVPRQKFTRGKIGQTARGKKALVYLKSGDKIDIM